MNEVANDKRVMVIWYLVHTPCQQFRHEVIPEFELLEVFTWRVSVNTRTSKIPIAYTWLINVRRC